MCLFDWSFRLDCFSADICNYVISVRQSWPLAADNKLCHIVVAEIDYSTIAITCLCACTTIFLKKSL